MLGDYGDLGLVYFFEKCESVGINIGFGGLVIELFFFFVEYWVVGCSYRFFIFV